MDSACLSEALTSTWCHKQEDQNANELICNDKLQVVSYLWDTICLSVLVICSGDICCIAAQKITISKEVYLI